MWQAAILLIGFILSAKPAMADLADAARIAQSSNATVGLVAGGAGSTDLSIASDLSKVLDDGAKLRVLPVLGRGSVQNIADLIYLKGIDVAIVHADVLNQITQHNAVLRGETIQYIAKLFEEEVHVLARKDITSLKDLDGKPVVAGEAGGGTELTAATLLGALHVSANIIHLSQSEALNRLSTGAVAAVFVVGGKPVPVLQGIEPGSGLHFLPIPLTTQLVDEYLPTNLDHQHYPALVPAGQTIDTVAVGSVLVTLAAASDTPRAKRVNRFVDNLFDRFDQLRQPGFHLKWQEVSLSAQVEGWPRYPEAATLVKKQEQSSASNLRTAFGMYLSQSGQSASGLNNERRDALFRDFLRWRDQRSER